MAFSSIPLLNARTSVASDLYVRALASAMRAFRLHDPDHTKIRESDMYEKARRDPIVAHAIDSRLHKVAGREWSVLPASDEKVDTIGAAIDEDAIKMIEGFSESRYEQAQAVIKARSYAYIAGRRIFTKLGGMPAMNWLVPTGLQDLDFRRVTFHPRNVTREDGSRDLSVQMMLFSIQREQWEIVERPELFVKTVYRDEEARLGYGRGLLESIYYYLWCKGEILKEGVQAVKKFARGVVVAKIDALRASSDPKDTAALQAAWGKVLQQMQAEHVITMDKADEIEVIDMPARGFDAIVKLIQLLDDGMTRLITGAVLPSGGGSSTGSLARAETESDESEALVQFDRDKIDEDYTRDLIGWFRMHNRQNFAALGLADAEPGRFETIQEKRKDPEIALTVITGALEAGMPVKKEEAYSRLTLTPPKEGDPIIEPKAPEPEFPGMGGGFPFQGGRDALKEVIREAFDERFRETRKPIYSAEMLREDVGDERFAEFTPAERNCIGPKVATLIGEGKERSQAVAIAIDTCAPSKSFVDKFGQRWVTIGAQSVTGTESKKGGIPVLIDDETGKIVKGPSGLEGKDLDTIDKNVEGTKKEKKPEPPEPKPSEPEPEPEAKANVLGSEKSMTGDESSRNRLGGGNNVGEVNFVTFKSGAKAVFKPTAGTGLKKIPDIRRTVNHGAANESQRERLCFLVDRALGLNLTPPVVMTGDGHYQAMVEGQTMAEARVTGATISSVDRTDLVKLAVLDLVIGNTDRHAGNFMVDKDNKLHAIDNGLAFPDKRGFFGKGGAELRSKPVGFLVGEGGNESEKETQAVVESVRPKLDDLLGKIDEFASDAGITDDGLLGQLRNRIEAASVEMDDFLDGVGGARTLWRRIVLSQSK